MKSSEKHERTKNQLMRNCDIMKKRNITAFNAPGRLDKWMKSEKFKLVACKVHKAGSTNIARILYTLDHLSKIEYIDKISKAKARNNADLETEETVESFQMRYKKYNKFMFVRDPLKAVVRLQSKDTPWDVQARQCNFCEFPRKSPGYSE